jgi:hypothetical protein
MVLAGTTAASTRLLHAGLAALRRGDVAHAMEAMRRLEGGEGEPMHFRELAVALIASIRPRGGLNPPPGRTPYENSDCSTGGPPEMARAPGSAPADNPINSGAHRITDVRRLQFEDR